MYSKIYFKKLLHASQCMIMLHTLTSNTHTHIKYTHSHQIHSLTQWTYSRQQYLYTYVRTYSEHTDIPTYSTNTLTPCTANTLINAYSTHIQTTIHTYVQYVRYELCFVFIYKSRYLSVQQIQDIWDTARSVQQ